MGLQDFGSQVWETQGVSGFAAFEFEFCLLVWAHKLRFQKMVEGVCAFLEDQGVSEME